LRRFVPNQMPHKQNVYGAFFQEDTFCSLILTHQVALVLY
jgi:hypothetical protein